MSRNADDNTEDFSVVPCSSSRHDTLAHSQHLRALFPRDARRVNATQRRNKESPRLVSVCWETWAPKSLQAHMSKAKEMRIRRGCQWHKGMLWPPARRPPRSSKSTGSAVSPRQGIYGAVRFRCSLLFSHTLMHLSQRRVCCEHWAIPRVGCSSPFSY